MSNVLNSNLSFKAQNFVIPNVHFNNTFTCTKHPPAFKPHFLHQQAVKHRFDCTKVYLLCKCINLETIFTLEQAFFVGLFSTQQQEKLETGTFHMSFHHDLCRTTVGNRNPNFMFPVDHSDITVPFLYLQNFWLSSNCHLPMHATLYYLKEILIPQIPKYQTDM